jgi:O-antigen ligase
MLDSRSGRLAKSCVTFPGVENGASVTLLVPGLTIALFCLAAMVGVRRMIFTIMVARPACDRLFDAMKNAIGEQSGPGAAVNALVICLALACALRWPFLLAAPVTMAWSLFLAAAAASLAGAEDPGAGLRLLATLVTYAAIFALPYAVVRNRRNAADCLKVALISSVVPVLYGLFELATSPGIVTGDERLQSTFNHPNILAFYFVSLVALILFLMSSRLATLSGRARVVLLAYMAVVIVLLLFTKTRSAWLSMGVMLAGYAILVDRRWLAGLALAPIVLVLPGVADRIHDLGSGNIAAGYEQLNSYAWRRILWAQTWEWMQANPSPFLGYGLDSFASLTPRFFPAAAQSSAGIGAHNALLQVYFETGILGSVAFATIFSALFYEMARRSKRDLAGSIVMSLNCAGYLIVCASDNLFDYLQFQWFFWFCLGVVCAAGRLEAAVVSQAVAPPRDGAARDAVTQPAI